MTTVERLYEEVMALSDDEREALITRIEIARFEIPPEVLDSWDREAEGALEAMEAGEPTIPWEKVRARMYERLNAARR
jgi:hypothetical protein